jgi:hypothetical protein
MTVDGCRHLVTSASIRKGNDNLGSLTIEEEVKVTRQKIQEGRTPLDGESNFGCRETLRGNKTLKEEGAIRGNQSQKP